MLGFAKLGKLALGEAAENNAAAVAAGVGSFTITGQDINAAITGASEVGAFAISGQAVSLNVVMPAEVGSFTISGQSAASALTISMAASAAPAVRQRRWFGFTALGKVALGLGGRANQPTFAITGQSISFGVGLPASVGVFVISGQDARLQQGAVLNTDAGVFVISGQDVNGAFSMPAAVGVFTITPQQVELARRTAKIRAFPRVGRNTISARPTGRDGIKIRAYGG